MVQDENADVEFSGDEGSSYYASNKDKISFKLIILTHLKKISEFASKEFLGGYWETKVDPKLNIEQKFYVPDTREIYSNAVECFGDLLYPHYDKKMETAFKKYEDDLKKAYETNTTEEAHPLKNDKKIRSFGEDSNKILFRTERQKVCRLLFRDLCCFLYRNNYLELGTIED